MAAWLILDPGEAVSFIDDIEVAVLSDAQLLALVTDLLHARCFHLVRAVLDVVGEVRWREVARSPPARAHPAVAGYLRTRFASWTEAPDQPRDASALVNQIMDTLDDYVRELLVLERRRDPDTLEDLRSWLEHACREQRGADAPELEALLEYVRRVARLGVEHEAPECSLAWLRTAYAGRWLLVTAGYDGGERPIGQLSLLSLLGVVRDHLEQETLTREPAWTPKVCQQSWHRPLWRIQGPGGDDPGAFNALMTATSEQGVLLCCTQPLQTIATVLTVVHEIADLGDLGRPWAEQFLIDVSPVLLDRLAESPPNEMDTWDHAQILAAYGELTRHDDLVRQVAEVLAERVRQGLSADALELRPAMKGVDPGLALAGCVFTLSQMPYRTIETFRMFAQIQLPLTELLALGDRSSAPFLDTGTVLAPGGPALVPETLTLTLVAFARLFGCTELENLPANLERFVLWLVERARGLVPEELATASSATLNRSQVVRITAALMQFRRPPPAILAFLREVARLSTIALEGYVALEDLEVLLDSYAPNAGDHLDLLGLYAAVTAKLTTLATSPLPTTSAVRLAVHAYNRCDMLLKHAAWYVREARRRAWRSGSADGATREQERDRDRERAEALQTRGKSCQSELEALLLAVVTMVWRALAAYSPSQQRRVLHELTRIQGLEISQAPNHWPKHDPPAVLGALAHTVAGVFGQLSASRTMIGPLAKASTHHLACVLHAYSWLRVHQPSDAELVRELLAELQVRAPRMSPSEVLHMLGVLGRLRHPPPELARFVDDMTERWR